MESKLMLTTAQIVAAGLADWRKLGQGLHARYLPSRLVDTSAFVAAIAELDRVVDQHLRISLGDGFIDLKLITPDAIYRDGDGHDEVVEWVTGRDLTLAAEITTIASRLGIRADPSGIATIELALDTADPSAIAPMWSALLTGSAEAHGRGTIGDDIRDRTGRVPILWFQQTEAHEPPRQRFHLDVWVAAECAAERIAAAVAAGGIIVDESNAPEFTILADAEGNKACVCTAV